MKATSKFSLFIFAPLLGVFLLLALFLVPSGMLIFFLISIFDPTISIFQAADYNAWGCMPILAVISLFLVGRWLYSWHRRHRMLAWIGIWALFTNALFLATWLSLTILTSLGASDYPIDLFLESTATISVLVVFIMQPIIWLWLYVSTRIIAHVEQANT